ncbi:hypothetical protein BP5796_07108 [Coleophoma crateriformis]|uniref:Uncharacterized protein n=1 Tax=Coleophoma crateriformis TaxID=565419 RepID=A0A3D8RI83_9HELO|nr:hypothetical protein BP5796_07108 [Coleophoma crateriformis]
MPSGSQSRAGTHRPVIETASTEKEARRVLDWQHDVAKSISSEGASEAGSGSESQTQSRYSTQTRDYRPEAPRRYESCPLPAPVEQRPMRLVRRVTETSQHWKGSNREDIPNTGLSSKTLIGTMLGAAAGAAIAYAMVRSEEPEEMPEQPRPMQRRASVSYAGSRPAYSSYGYDAPSVHVVDRIEMEPARTYVSTRDSRPPRYSYTGGNYTVAASRPPLSGRSDMHRIEDRRHSRDEERFLNNDASVVSRPRSRSISEAGSHRPLTILPPPPKSQITSLTALPPLPPSTVARSHVSRASSKHEGRSEAGRSKVPSRAPSQSGKSAAKSHVSSSTVKPLTYVPPQAQSRVSTSTVKMIPRSELGGEGSRVTARHVPLPRSVISGVGYERSVAPSDSVSNAGSRRSHRY